MTRFFDYGELETFEKRLQALTVPYEVRKRVGALPVFTPDAGTIGYLGTGEEWEVHVDANVLLSLFRRGILVEGE